MIFFFEKNCFKEEIFFRFLLNIQERVRFENGLVMCCTIIAWLRWFIFINEASFYLSFLAHKQNQEQFCISLQGEIEKWDLRGFQFLTRSENEFWQMD